MKGWAQLPCGRYAPNPPGAPPRLARLSMKCQAFPGLKGKISEILLGAIILLSEVKFQLNALCHGSLPLIAFTLMKVYVIDQS